ncbi:MAG: ABC transporter substrate-binding protein [Sphingobacteriales bacterium]|nr:MAG: ABC transporter substrate-binding protein [Sphingobacteriales bacterium]
MKKHIIFLLPLLLFFASCGRFGNTDEEENNNERIVCIAKQYNEIIWALGAEKDIVAVDISSTFPPETKKLPTVGYHRALSAEAILAMNPTMIIHDNNIGPEHVTKQLEDLKIPMKVFSKSENDIESTKALFREMGKYFNKEKQADSLCQKLDNDMKKALENRKKYTDSPKVLIIHFGQASNVYLVMTKKSTANKLLNWAGGILPIEDEKGMRQMSAEVIAQADPDIILLTDFGYDRLGSTQKIMELPGVSSTKAAKNNRIYRVEEHDMVYIGPRTGEIVLKLQELIHGKK